MAVSDRSAQRDQRRKIRRDRMAHPTVPVVPPGLEGGQYRPLKQSQIERISQAALTVLEETGIEVQPSACREVWARFGARIDSDNNRVYIPRTLIHEALASAARTVRLCGQSPEFDLELGQTRVYLGTGGAAVKVLDLESGEVRESTLRDLYDIGRLVEVLDNIHFYHRPVVARDIPSSALDLNTYYACLSATRKHIMGNSFTPEYLREVVELAAMFTDGPQALRERPFISFSNCWTVSPLRYALETVEVLDEIVKQGMPVAISSAPQAGATSPATLAGTLVQITAEQLSGITYINLLNPGHPVLLGYVPSVADLRTGSFSGGAAEFALMNAACAQIGQHLGLPVYNSSALSDSKLPDAQAGYEKGISTVTAALAGSNYVHHSAGMLESLLTVAYEQYVIDDDINASVLRMVRGIEVTEESLAVDVIHDVCTGAGHFLGHPQTLDLMNTEYYYPHTSDRSTRTDWEARGSLDMSERARQRARELLATQWPTHVSAKLDAHIRERFEILLPREIMQPK